MDDFDKQYNKTVFKILIEANEQPSDTNVVVTHCIEYKLKDPIKKSRPDNNKILDFIEDMAETELNYIRLLEESHARLELVKLQYKNRPYTVRMIRRIVSDEEKVSESDLDSKSEVASSSGYSSDSEHLRRKRILSIDTQSDKESNFSMKRYQPSDDEEYPITLDTQSDTEPDKENNYSDDEEYPRILETHIDTGPDKENKFSADEEYPRILKTRRNKIIIGPHGTTVDRKSFELMSWKVSTTAIGQLCDIVFGERVLITHSLARKSPWAYTRSVKKTLDPLKVEDITFLICSKFNVTKANVRRVIAMKTFQVRKRFAKSKKSSK